MRDATERLFDPEGKRHGAIGRRVRALQARRTRLAALGFFEEVQVVEAQLVRARAAMAERCAAEFDLDYEARVADLATVHAARRQLHEERLARAGERRAQTASIIAEQRKNAEALAVINDIPLLKPSAELEKNELAELLEPKSFVDGHVMIVEGETESPPELVIVAKGSVDVVVKSGVVVAMMDAPFYVGEGRLITGEAASASVRAKGEVDVLILSAANFRMLATRAGKG